MTMICFGLANPHAHVLRTLLRYVEEMQSADEFRSNRVNHAIAEGHLYHTPDKPVLPGAVESRTRED